MFPAYCGRIITRPSLHFFLHPMSPTRRWRRPGAAGSLKDCDFEDLAHAPTMESVSRLPTTSRFRSPVHHGGHARRTLLPGECREELDQLRAETVGHFVPAPGPESAIVNEVVGVLHRLKRVDRARQLVVRHWLQHFLDHGPGPDPKSKPPRPPAKDDPYAFLGPPTPREKPCPMHDAYTTATKKVSMAEESLEITADLMANLSLIIKQYGTDEAADFARQFVAGQADFGDNGHPVALELSEDEKNADKYVAAFKSAMANFQRRTRRQLKPLQAELATIEGELTDLLVTGMATAVDPAAPNLNALGRERCTLIGQYRRLLRGLAETRSLGILDTSSTQSMLRALPGGEK